VAPLVAVVHTPPAGLLRLAVERQRTPEVLPQQVEPHLVAKHRQLAFHTSRKTPAHHPTQFHSSYRIQPLKSPLDFPSMWRESLAASCQTLTAMSKQDIGARL
jgi:hypothetical protein